MYHLILLVCAGAALVPAQTAAGFWVQIAAVPSGTTDASKTEVVPGAAQGGATGSATPGNAPGAVVPGTVVPGGVVPGAVVAGGAAGVPAAGQQNSGPASVPARSPIPGIVTGAGTGAINRTPSPGGPNVSGGGITNPAQPAASECEVKLLVPHTRVGAAGGEFGVSIAPLPPECQPPIAASGTWLQVASGAGGNTLRFLAAANTSPEVRVATVVIGNRSLVIEQAGLIRTRIAASPGRVVLGLSRKPTPQRREITIWTDNPSSRLDVTSTAKWIRVEAGQPRKRSARLLQLTVDSASLAPDMRHEGSIVISADGAPPLEIPVLVEGIGLR